MYSYINLHIIIFKRSAEHTLAFEICITSIHLLCLSSFYVNLLFNDFELLLQTPHNRKNIKIRQNDIIPSNQLIFIF